MKVEDSHKHEPEAKEPTTIEVLDNHDVIMVSPAKKSRSLSTVAQSTHSLVQPPNPEQEEGEEEESMKSNDNLAAHNHDRIFLSRFR